MTTNPTGARLSPHRRQATPHATPAVARDTRSDTEATPALADDTPRDTPATPPATPRNEATMTHTLSNPDRFLQATDCEALTGIPAATWRYWAHIGSPIGRRSFKLGRRRVWRESTILAWVAEQENNTRTDGGES